jgi:hypothetical protein
MPPKPTGPKPPGYRNARQREEDFRQNNINRLRLGLPPLRPPIRVVEGIPIEGDIPGLPVARVAEIRPRLRGGLQRGMPVRREEQGRQHHQQLNAALEQGRQEIERGQRRLGELNAELRRVVLEVAERQRARTDSTVSNASSTSTEGSR